MESFSEVSREKQQNDSEHFGGRVSSPDSPDGGEGGRLWDVRGGSGWDSLAGVGGSVAIEERTASETSQDLPPGWRKVRGPARTIPRRLSGTQFTGA